MLPTFADPKTPFVFKRIFGAEAHKPLLIELLNALLELDGPSRIVDVQHLSRGQRIAVPELRLSVVDAQCTDEAGRRCIVKVQVLIVEGFEKPVVYNAGKSYVMQPRHADEPSTLCDVVGVTICDFTIWPATSADGRYEVPMLSRWRMQEQQSQTVGQPRVQYVFLELPKYSAGANPTTTMEKWTYLFREARNLDVVPPPLSERPFRDALDVARNTSFTPVEWEAYQRAKMAEQDARGALSLAHREGVEEGKRRVVEEGKRQGLAAAMRRGIADLCEVLGIVVTAERQAELAGAGLVELEMLRERIKRERRWE